MSHRTEPSVDVEDLVATTAGASKRASRQRLAAATNATAESLPETRAQRQSRLAALQATTISRGKAATHTESTHPKQAKPLTIKIEPPVEPQPTGNRDASTDPLRAQRQQDEPEHRMWWYQQLRCIAKEPKVVPVRYHERASISFCLAIQCISMTDSVSFRTSPKAFCISNNNQHGKTVAAAANVHRRHSSSLLCWLSRRRCRHVQCP